MYNRLDCRTIVAGIFLGLIHLSWFCRAASGWGEEGHILITQAAANKVPKTMPAFMRDAGDLLGYLCVQPDRWKHTARELNMVEAANHFLDAENLNPMPKEIRFPSSRLEFLGQISSMGLKVDAVGLLPYQISEYFFRLKCGFMEYRWALQDPKGRAARSPRRSGSLKSVELGCLYYAGILAHYAGDASQPLHATVFYDGRGPDGQPGKTGVHYRFEVAFVDSYVSVDSVEEQLGRPRVYADILDATRDVLAKSNGQVNQLLELDEKGKLLLEDPEAVNLAMSCLAAGSQFLLDLWYSAWVKSGDDLQAYQERFRKQD